MLIPDFADLVGLFSSATFLLEEAFFFPKVFERAAGFCFSGDFERLESDSLAAFVLKSPSVDDVEILGLFRL